VLLAKNKVEESNSSSTTSRNIVASLLPFRSIWCAVVLTKSPLDRVALLCLSGMYMYIFSIFGKRESLFTYYSSTEYVIANFDFHLLLPCGSAFCLTVLHDVMQDRYLRILLCHCQNKSLASSN
jgi:hypothetical protein